MFTPRRAPMKYFYCKSVWQSVICFVCDTQKLLRKQLSLSFNQQVLHGSCVKASPPRSPLHTLFCYDVYNSIRFHVERSTDRINFWNKYFHANHPFLVGMFQVYADENVTTLKFNAALHTCACSIIIKFYKKVWPVIVDHGYNFAGFTSVCTKHYKEMNMRKR